MQSCAKKCLTDFQSAFQSAHDQYQLTIALPLSPPRPAFGVRVLQHRFTFLHKALPAATRHSPRVHLPRSASPPSSVRRPAPGFLSPIPLPGARPKGDDKTRQNATEYDKRIAKKAVERKIHERLSTFCLVSLVGQIFAPFCTMKPISKLYQATLGKHPSNSQLIDHK